MDTGTVPPGSAAAELAGLLDSPEIAELVRELGATRWTGRPGYPLRAMVGMALAKSIYSIPTWTRTVALVREHAALREAIGGSGEPPSHWACYRFARKLRAYKPLLDACLDRVTARLHDAHPEMGRDVAIDGSDLPAYANGQRYVSKDGPERERFSDPDASWGHRSAVSTRKGGGYYGYKVHAAVDVATGLPLAWTVETASAAETNFALPLIDTVRERGFAVGTAIMDKGYDNGPIHDGCMDRNVSPVTALRKTGRVKAGENKPPTCEHGEWTFAGADYKRKATKWRCPTGECKPASRWVKADRLHPLIPRESERSRRLYRGRGAVEREFGRLKHEWGASPAPRARDRARSASRRPHDPRQAGLRAQSSAGGAARGVDRVQRPAVPASSDSSRAIDGIQLRIREAGKHFKAIQDVVEGSTGKPRPYTTQTEFDARRSRVLLRAVDVQPVPPELGILIGECVYQLRAALDNLVYALAERYRGAPLPARIAKNAAFPIRNSGSRYREIAPKRLAAVDPRVAALIERLQPYHRRKKPAARALWQLEELRNIDQHRLLHPAATHRDWSRYRLDYPPGDLIAPGDFKAFNRPLKENALLARFDVVTGVPEPKVYVEEDAAIDVMFEKGSPARSVRQASVIATLSGITTYVRGEVLEALLPFLGQRTH